MYGLNTLRQLFLFKYVATYLLTKCNGKFDFRKSNVQMAKVIWHLQFSHHPCWSPVMASLTLESQTCKYKCYLAFAIFTMPLLVRMVIFVSLCLVFLLMNILSYSFIWVGKAFNGVQLTNFTNYTLGH